MCALTVPSRRMLVLVSGSRGTMVGDGVRALSVAHS
jgi:hypothetical protein